MCKALEGVTLKDRDPYLEVGVSGRVETETVTHLFALIADRYPEKDVLFNLSYDVHITLTHRQVKELFAKTRSTIQKRAESTRVAVHTAKMGDFLLLKFAATLYNGVIGDRIRVFQSRKPAENWIKRV